MKVRERLVNLLSRLRRVFFNRPSVVQTREGTQRLAIRTSRSNWIVGRGLCMYRCEDFTGVPRSRRRSALELKLPVWSPFERTGHHCVWSGSTAMVWFWDLDTVAAGTGAGAGSGDGAGAAGGPRAGGGGRGAGGVRVLPETLFYPRKPDGLHLQPCREGFELQHWRGDVLADAFWFPARPNEDQLSWFAGRQESAAVAIPTAGAPRAADGAMAPEPWSVSLTPGEWLEANERRLVAACLLALSLAVVWQEARLWKLRQLEQAAAASLARMQDELGPLLEARNEVVRLRQTNQGLRALLAELSQAHLMSLVDRALPSESAEFREWHYQQRELRIVIEASDLDPIAYVRALEAEPLFVEVRAEPVPGSNDRLELTLRVQG